MQKTEISNPQLEVLTDEEVKAIKKKSVAGVVSFFTRTLLLQAIGLITGLVLSAYLTPEDFGIYGVVIQIVGILQFFSDIGLASSLIQKKKEPSTQQYRAAFTLQQILSWLIVLVSIILIVIGFVEPGIKAWLLLSFAISFPLASLKTVSSVKLERKLEFSKLVIPAIFEQLSFNIVLIYFAISGQGVASYIYAIITRSVLGFIIMWLIKPWEIGLNFNFKALKSLLSFGAKFQLNDLLARVKDQFFYLALSRFFSNQVFGYINWAKTQSMYPYNLTVQNVMAITFSTYSRLKSHLNLLKKAIEKSIYFVTLSIFPLIIGMTMFIRPLTEVVPQYAKWQPAILSFVLFTISILSSAIATPIINSLNALGYINKTLKMMIFWTLLTWTLTPMMIHQFGYNGVAISAFIISLSSLYTIKMINDIVKINFWKNVKVQIIAAIAMSLVGFVGQHIWAMNILSLLLGMGFCFIIYVIVILLVGFDQLIQQLDSIGLNPLKLLKKYI